MEILAQKGNWFKGRVYKKVGIFPKSCVKLISRRSLHKDRHHIGRPAQQQCEYVLSLHSFEGEDQELSFKRGTVIKVLGSKGVWWQGQLEDGAVGFFPRNYVKPLKRKQTSNNPTQKNIATPFPVLNLCMRALRHESITARLFCWLICPTCLLCVVSSLASFVLFRWPLLARNCSRASMVSNPNLKISPPLLPRKRGPHPLRLHALARAKTCCLLKEHAGCDQHLHPR